MLTITNQEFSQLAAYIKANYGINFKEEKRALVTGRLHVLIQNNFRNFSEYYEHILTDKTGNAAATLINKITTNHTFFMRDSYPSCEWRLNYFRKIDNEKSVLVDRIRNEVIYRKFNLMDSSFPFKRKFHVIFCRNVIKNYTLML